MNKRSLNLEESIELLKATFVSLNERDIFTGDRAEVWVITSDGIKCDSFDLKKD